jgi:hypothetical protein
MVPPMFQIPLEIVPVLFSVVMMPKFRIEESLDAEIVPLLLSVVMVPSFSIAALSDEIVPLLLLFSVVIVLVLMSP